MSAIWTVREYEKSDWPSVSKWWDYHAKGGHLFQNMLPPVGVVVERDDEPVCACWLYLSVNIGVCFLEHAVSKPGLKLSDARKSFQRAIGALEAVAKTHGYGVMECHTLPSIARILRGFGFTEDPRPKKSVVKLLTYG